MKDDGSRYRPGAKPRGSTERAQPSVVETAQYIASMSAELAQLADEGRLPAEIAYMLRMAALAADRLPAERPRPRDEPEGSGG